MIENAIFLAFLHFGFGWLRRRRFGRTTVLAPGVLPRIGWSAVISGVLARVLAAVLPAVVSGVFAAIIAIRPVLSLGAVAGIVIAVW